MILLSKAMTFWRNTRSLPRCRRRIMQKRSYQCGVDAPNSTTSACWEESFFTEGPHRSICHSMQTKCRNNTKATLYNLPRQKTSIHAPQSRRRRWCIQRIKLSSTSQKPLTTSRTILKPGWRPQNEKRNPYTYGYVTEKYFCRNAN